jgi:hypothetical protein
MPSPRGSTGTITTSPAIAAALGRLERRLDGPPVSRHIAQRSVNTIVLMRRAARRNSMGGVCASRSVSSASSATGCETRRTGTQELYTSKIAPCHERS